MPNDLELKKMPQSLEAERGVLGSMILDNSCITDCASILSDSDFYSKQYRTVFNTIVQMDSKGEVVDFVSLHEKLKSGQDASLATIDFLKNLTDTAVVSNVKNYCNIVKEKAALRQIINALGQVSQKSYEGSENSEDILEQASQQIYDIQKSKHDSKVNNISQIAEDLVDKIEQASKLKGGIVGVPSGFKYLDKTLSGFQKQNLIILAARTGMGKTSFALNVASNAALSYNKTVAIFSLEMSSVEIMSRIVSMDAIISSKTLREGSLSEDNWNSMIRSIDNICKSKLIIDDTPAITISELRAKCRRLKEKSGLDLVIIDYLQLMRFREKPMENRQQEVAEISRSLKALAKELDVPIIALAQVSRTAEQGESKIPQLSHLRESGAIEQDADVVLFIHRPYYYARGNEENASKDTNDTNSSQNDATINQKEAKIIVAKHRNGETGVINIVFEPTLTKFYDTDSSGEQYT